MAINIDLHGMTRLANSAADQPVDSFNGLDLILRVRRLLLLLAKLEHSLAPLLLGRVHHGEVWADLTTSQVADNKAAEIVPDGELTVLLLGLLRLGRFEP